MKASFQNRKLPLGEVRKTITLIWLARNKLRSFKHISAMSDDTPKRRSKITYRIPKAKEEAFDQLHAQSGMSVNAMITHKLFSSGGHDPAKRIRLSQILDETARIKASTEAQALMSEDIANELKLIRTALMSLMGRRS